MITKQYMYGVFPLLYSLTVQTGFNAGYGTARVRMLYDTIFNIKHLNRLIVYMCTLISIFMSLALFAPVFPNLFVFATNLSSYAFIDYTYTILTLCYALF